VTYTLQELEDLCAEVERTRLELATPVVENQVAAQVRYGAAMTSLSAAARTAIPELIARIKELDLDFHAKPPAESIARAQELSREAGAKRAKLEDALAKAKLGNTDELRALGLEAYFEEDGTVKIRQKACAQERR